MRRRTLFALLLAGTTALYPSAAFAMPAVLAAFVLPFLVSSPVFFLGPAAISAIAMGIGYAAAAAGLFALQTAFKPDVPKAPKPEDGKYNLRQPVSSLTYCLGRNKKGGDYVFLEEMEGTAYHITVLAGHSIQGFAEHWLHDEHVLLDAEGYVIGEQFAPNTPPPPSFVRILTRLGLNAETAYADVVATFPTVWTANHRGDGLASVRMSADTVSAEDYQKVYPQQMPLHTAVLDGNNKIYDPRTSTYVYTTNLALFRLWHLTHPVGGKLSLDDMYLPEWTVAADVCDEDVTNRTGGVENRYHGGLWFRAENDPVQVGMLMDQAGELVVYERSDGKVGVHPGKYVAPDIRLTDRDIIAVSFDANRRRSSNVLAVRGRYTSPKEGFVTVDAAIYGNPYIGESTERTRTLENQAVQSHNHMARLQKITYTRANAPRVSVLAHYAGAKDVPYRRFVRVHMPPRMDEAVIELTGRPKLSLRNLTVEFSGIVVPSSLYDFDATTEEGAPGSSVTPVVHTGIPLPVNFAVAIQREAISGGATAAYALATWNYVSDALTYEFEWQPSAGGDRLTARSSGGETSKRSGYLADGVQYNFRFRTWSSDTPSAWTAPIVLTAVANATAPAALTGISATGGMGSVAVAFTTPASNAPKTIKRYRTPSGVTLDRVAHLIETIEAQPGTAYARTDGDATRINLFGNPNFDTDTVWVLQPGWSITGGKAVKTPGTGTAIRQIGLSLGVAGDVLRYRVTISNHTVGATLVRLYGGTTVSGITLNSNATYYSTITGVAGNTEAGFETDGAFDGSLDDTVLFIQTASCLPQGAYDDYIEPLNSSGVAGPLVGPLPVNVI